MKMAKNEFKVTLTLKSEKDDEKIHFKMDGERFTSRRTVKLSVDACYILSLVFRPPVHINAANIMGSSVTAAETARDSDSASYTINWGSTGITATRKGQRDNLLITLEIGGHGTLTINLQVKFYKVSSSQHCTWGDVLHHIDYDCHHKDGTLYIDVEREIFR